MNIAEREIDRSAVSALIRDYLLSTGDSGILEVAKQEAADEMERRSILEEHEKHFSTRIIKENGRKPRYETYVLKDGKRKPLRRSTLTELHNAIVDFYKSEKEANKPTAIKDVHMLWRKLRVATKSPSTVHKDDWVWNTYYEGTPFAETNINDLTTPDITLWLMSQVKEHNLSQRQFREMKSLLNGVIDYAVSASIAVRNPAREIHGVSLQVFRQTEPPKREEQVIDGEDQKAFIAYCFEMYHKVRNVVYLGIVLNFLLGVRVGELSSIAISDIDRANLTLTLQRSEVSCKKDVDGKMVSDGSMVVSYLKRGRRSRPVPLTRTALDIIGMIERHYQEAGIETEWLLTNNRGERVTKIEISDTIWRINQKLGLPNRGNHSIRKTVITEMIQSMMFTQKEIQTYFGHEDFSTTSRYYDFALNDTAQNAAKMNKVLTPIIPDWVQLGNIG